TRSRKNGGLAATSRLAGRSPLCCLLGGRTLARRSPLGCLLGCRALLGRSPLGCLLGGRALTRRRPLDSLLGGRALARRRPLDCLLCWGPLLRSLLGRSPSLRGYCHRCTSLGALSLHRGEACATTMPDWHLRAHCRTGFIVSVSPEE